LSDAVQGLVVDDAALQARYPHDAVAAARHAGRTIQRLALPFAFALTTAEVIPDADVTGPAFRCQITTRKTKADVGAGNGLDTIRRQGGLAGAVHVGNAVGTDKGQGGVIARRQPDHPEGVAVGEAIRRAARAQAAHIGLDDGQRIPAATNRQVRGEGLHAFFGLPLEAPAGVNTNSGVVDTAADATGAIRSDVEALEDVVDAKPTGRRRVGTPTRGSQGANLTCFDAVDTIGLANVFAADATADTSRRGDGTACGRVLAAEGRPSWRRRRDAGPAFARQPILAVEARAARAARGDTSNKGRTTDRQTCPGKSGDDEDEDAHALGVAHGADRA
jgi:hypothetical protein